MTNPLGLPSVPGVPGPTPQIIQPQPSPQTWIADTQPNGVVTVQIFSVTGMHVSFLTPDDAIRIGGQIADAGRRARSGIIIAPNGALPPPPQSRNGRPG